MPYLCYHSQKSGTDQRSKKESGLANCLAIVALRTTAWEGSMHLLHAGGCFGQFQVCMLL